MNILLTSVGRRSYLVKYFQEALNFTGEVHVANSSNKTPAFEVADKAVVTPLIYDNDYIPFLKKYCIENNISAIVSLFDVDLPILAKHKAEFQNIGITVVVSDYFVIERCNDKWETYRFLVDSGFNAPRTFLKLEDSLDMIHSGTVSFPLIVKPRWGMGSIAVFEAENEDELKVFYSKTKKSIQNTYLKYESAKNIEECVIIQEKLIGQEYGLDVINDLRGKYVTTIPKMKYAMRSGETDCAVTVDNTNLKNLGEKLSNKLQHVANLDVDVFEVDEKFYILEMNARFGGGYPFSHMAGVNLPLAIINWLNGKKVNQEILTPRINIMSQKDINLVRLHSNLDTQVRKLSDLEKMFELISEYGQYLTPTLQERNTDIQAYAEKIFCNGVFYYITNHKNKIMGILAAYMNDVENRNAYLTFLAIKDGYRGMGAGRKLLCVVEDDAKKSGMTSMRLEVRKNNVDAINFYKAYGYFYLNNASETSFYMEKKL